VIHDLDSVIDPNWATSHRKLMLVTRDGLGDHIVAAGLAHWLAQKVDTVYVPCRAVYWTSVNWMFDAIPNVIPIGLEPGQNWHDLELLSQKLGAQLLRSNLGYPLTTSEPWFRATYSQYQLPYSTRFDLWPSPVPGPHSDRLLASHSHDKPLIVIHNHSNERNSYDIDTVLGRSEAEINKYHTIEISTTLSNNLFDWMRILMAADEIHLVESSVFHLCQQISYQLRAKVFFHHIRDFSPHQWERDLQPWCENWNWIEYPIKQWR
jgi:hypothetical protein